MHGRCLFQSTLPARGATVSPEPIPASAPLFQSTLPARGATVNGFNTEARSLYFNPRSPHGERRSVKRTKHGRDIFQSTLPARGATVSPEPIPASAPLFQSTLPARGATPSQYTQQRNVQISIHAPRTGSDQTGGDTLWQREISIHAPRTGSDSTWIRPCCARRYFNPRSPHGERQRKVTILSIRIIGFAQKVYHKTVLLRISLAENAVILPKRPQNPVRTSLQKAGGLRFARAIRAARPYSISSPSGA